MTVVVYHVSPNKRRYLFYSILLFYSNEINFEEIGSDEILLDKIITDRVFFVQLFLGNTDTSTTVQNMFDGPVLAHAIRIYPLQYNGAMSMRFELLGCIYGKHIIIVIVIVIIIALIYYYYYYYYYKRYYYKRYYYYYYYYYYY